MTNGLRVSEPGDSHEREADAIAALVTSGGRTPAVAAPAERQVPRASSGQSSSTGKSLDAATRTQMESGFGVDFRDVRIHDDAQSANAAAGLDARAYTLGADIVFGSGQYAPASAVGRQLIAHELAHVVQQRAAPPQIQRAPAFGAMYGKALAHNKDDYDTYKSKIGPTEATSQAPGAQHALQAKYMPLTLEELLEVFTGVAKDIDDKKVTAKVVSGYLDSLNEAFRTFMIDTVEAQASFLGNAFAESDQFRYLTETEKAVEGNPAYQANPTTIRLNKTYLDCAARRSQAVKDKRTPAEADEKVCPNTIDYEPGGSINTMKNDWQKSFIGRGAIQTTHRHYYVQVLAVMEHRAEELEAVDPKSSEAKKLRNAVKAIAADPQQAANPEHTFMFSVALLKMADDRGVRGDVKAAKGQSTGYMGQQPKGPAAIKAKAYAKAHGVLMRKWEVQESQYGYDVPDDPINTGAFGHDASTDVRPGPVRTTTIRS